MNEVIPTDITANKQTSVLTIAWNDGQTCTVPFNLLRAACPCASCRGGHEFMSAEPDPEVYAKKLADSPATRLRRVEAVGSYALMFEWEDGHSYGIYNWHYLRALCEGNNSRQ